MSSLQIHSQSDLCLAFAYPSPMWHQSLHSVENPVLTHLFCKQSAFTTTELARFCRMPGTQILGVCAGSLLLAYCVSSTSDGNNGKGRDRVFSWFNVFFWERGKKSEAFYFPTKSGRKRSDVLAVREIWPSCKGLFCFLMQTHGTTPLDSHGDAYPFSKLSSLSELLDTVLTQH